jgi:hypothetical protein
MGGPPASRPAAERGGGTGVPRDLQQGLTTAGLLKPGEPPAPALRQLVGDLHSKLGTPPPAVPASTMPELATQLRQAITTLQERSGLPQTGKLDQDTLGELARRGLVSSERPSSAATEVPRPVATAEAPRQATPPASRPRDVYDRQAEPERSARGRRETTLSEGVRPREPRSTREVKVSRAGLDDRAAQETQRDRDVKLSLSASLLGRELGTRGQSPAAASGAGRSGAEQAADALRTASAREQAAPADPPARGAPPREVASEPPPRLDSTRFERPERVIARRGLDNAGAATSDSARRPPVESASRSEAQARSATSTSNTLSQAQVTTSAPMATASQSATAEQARSASSLGLQDPSGRGVTPDRADPLASQGQGTTPGEGAGQTDQLGLAPGGAVREASGSDGTGAHEEPDATERDTGNSEAGDERFDDEGRGHASGDDGSGDGDGYYRVPPLSEQIQAALLTILREPERQNLATTYCWDVTLYRPDVYGPGQPAPVIFHLVVDNADAFDPVWQRAREELARHLARLEPDQPAPAEDDFLNALHRARVADGAAAENERSVFDQSPTEPVPISDKFQR